MADIFHQFGADLMLSPTGDLAVVTGAILTQQRLLRRLLTNQGDYIWNLDYGAGLAAYVGQADTSGIAARVRGQVFKEPSVAPVPLPVVDIQSAADGTVMTHIRYADAATGTTQLLSFSAGA